MDVFVQGCAYALIHISLSLRNILIFFCWKWKGDTIQSLICISCNGDVMEATCQYVVFFCFLACMCSEFRCASTEFHPILYTECESHVCLMANSVKMKPKLETLYLKSIYE